MAGVCKSISLDGNAIAVLDEKDAERYLGRKLCFEDCMQTEVSNRIAAGWAAFHNHKAELCNKNYRLQDRAMLFDACVTPTVLYGCSTWTVTHTMQRQLRTAQRKMLRYVFLLHRRSPKEWVDYMKRSTHRLQELAADLGVLVWTEVHWRRKWCFAGRLARQTDSRWSALVLNWRPNHGFGRSRGRPCTRWSDPIESFAGGDWQKVAIDPEQWEAFGGEFVRFSMSF